MVQANIFIHEDFNSASGWRPAQGVPYLSPYGSWDRLQPIPCDPDKNKQKRIDGWKTLISPHLERSLIVIWYLDIDFDLDILFPLDGV